MSERFVPDLFERLDLTDLYQNLPGYPKMVRCPVHQDDSPSLAVYRKNTHCFGCGAHETIQQHLWRVFRCDRAEQGRAGWKKFFFFAEKMLHREVVLDGQVDVAPLDLDLPLRYHQRLMLDSASAFWFRDRYGLTMDTLEAACIGHNGRSAFSIPIHSAPTGEYVSLKFRRDDRRKQDGDKYFSLRGYGQTRLYLPPLLRSCRRLSEYLPHAILPGSSSPYNHRSVVLTEGEMDALALVQLGIPAVSFTSGAKGILGNDAPLVRHLAGCTVWVAYDRDSIGRQNSLEVVRLLSATGITAGRITWDPAWGKDSAELVRRGMTRMDLKSIWKLEGDTI